MLVAALGLHAETGRSAWLRYSEWNGITLTQYRQSVPAAVTSLGDAPVIESARG
jgi:hypothetical protein